MTSTLPADRGAKATPAAPSHEIVVRIALSDCRAGPVVRPPSSREIARRKAAAEAAARDAAAALALERQVQPGLRPPPGRLFAVDAAGLLLRGPRGGVGTSERMVRTLGVLAAGGRHQPAALVAAGAWKDEGALRDALVAIGGKLAAIGLRVDRRKTGLRMAKVKDAAGR